MRALLLGGSLAALALVGALAFAFRGESSDLWSRPLDPDQVAEISARLTAWDVPFTTTPDNIRIDPARKRDVMMRLMMVGVPHQHVATSRDTLDQVNALTPEQVLDEKKLAGLEGDLAIDLRNMNGVIDARVNIAAAQQGVFLDEKGQDASAAVFLTLDANAPLSSDAVAGIQQYVASAVPGLSADRVQIMDQSGELLTSRHGGIADRALQANVQAMLDRAVGPGLTFVQAHVDTEMTSTTQREVKQLPLAGAAVASAVSKEHYEGKSKSYDKIRENDSRGSDTVDKSIHTDAGATKRVSIAVVVDQSKAAMIPAIKSLVTASAGLVASRGDVLTVQTSASLATNVPGAAPVVKPGSPAPELASLGSFGFALPYVVLALAILMGLAVITKPFFSMMIANAERAQVRQRQAEFADFEPARVKAALAGEPPHAAAAILAALPASTTARVLEMYDPERREAIARRLARPLSPIVRDVGAQAGGA
jgi:flagellar M-ring protein FliF